MMPRFPCVRFPIARSLAGVLACVVVAGSAVVGRACDACAERLIDESLEPPTAFSEDFAEAEPAQPSTGPGLARGAAVPAARQPSGALSGRIVFMNSGHGWTWDPDYWRLQRGVLQEMNEDYGNLDQLNFFASWCFNAGAIVVPLRPLGHQVNEVVLDNDSPGVTFAGAWSNSISSVFFGSAGDVPYRYAALSAAESATATYTPSIPEAGIYPVYTWVRHGSDRGHQLYRIRHTGGESQVRLPHHMVGNGWIYLGEYHFDAGSNAAAGSVAISNLRGTPTGSVVIADAIRFGNGMGSVDRGTGRSTYPREEENCRYWIQASLGQGQSATLYNGAGADESDSWSAPPKMSAEMNREAAGGIHDRIHISFHSNAGGGRGTLALITSDPTPNQSRLAQLCGAEVNNDLVALGSPPLEVPWQNRTTVTYSGGYSEIDGSLFGYEMNATIIEVAFHDNVSDARLMRDPKVRGAVGKAAMHAVVRYMNEFDGGSLVFAPESPSGLRVRANGDGSVTLNWAAPVSTGGSGAATGYVLYRSTNGVGFGLPIEVGNGTSATVAGLPTWVEHYFRVAAVNAGGESFPSEVAGCRARLGGGREVLVVNAFDRYDRTLNVRQEVTRQGYGPPDATGAIERVLPRRTNAFDYVVPHGKALGASGYAFDSCQNENIATDTVNLGDYRVVLWACGQESVADETFSAAEQARITAFRNSGGRLFVSGSEIAWDLDRASGPTSGDRSFFNGQLKADLAGDANDNANSYTITATSGGLFAGMPAFTFDDGTRGLYPVQTPDVLTPVGMGSVGTLTYAGNGNGFGGIQYDGSQGDGRLVYLGFPFETITGSATRAEVMRRVIEFLDGPEILVAAGSGWRFLDTGEIPLSHWTTRQFDDGAWASGMAQLGFGDGDEVTLVRNDPSRTTTWFRRTFEVGNPRQYGELRLRLLRDDGALVWLNGKELARSNLPASGSILPSTQALAVVGGADESVFFPHTGDPRHLRAGENVIAVEVHQFGLSSSDLSFDLELGGVVGQGVVLVPSGSVWRYRDNGAPPPSDWTSATYNDAAWSSGPARLGYGGDGEVTTVGHGGDPANVHPVTWFRHTFAVADAAAFDALEVELQRDDGAVVFLNGGEILRDNLRSGVVAADARASSTVGGANEQAWYRFIVPASGLRNGANVIAVQIHQATANSSDLAFDLRLRGLAHASIAFADWQATMFGSDATIPTIAGDLADPERDGRVNLMEYATGSWPDSRDDGPPHVLAIDGDYLTVRFSRNALATDIAWFVQASDSLAGPWVNIAAGLSGNPLEPLLPGVLVTEAPTGAFRQVVVRDGVAMTDAAYRQRFIRLAATR